MEKQQRNKKLLLDMADRGEPRASSKTKIGSALMRYTNKSRDVYDHDFDREIRKRAPHWFKNNTSES